MRDDYDVVLKAGQAHKQYWRDVLQFRELLWFLVWRNILVRYKQAVIGVLWAVLRPLLMMIVFSFIFGRIAQIPTPGGTPYPLLVFCGLVPWFYFSAAVAESSSSLLSDAALISKVYFPRILVPLSSILVTGVDLFITLILLGGLMIYMGHVPPLHAVFLPFFVLLLFLTATGLGVLMSALNVKYRDFVHVVPFVLQIGMFASPVVYTSDVIPEPYRIFYFLNPVAGVVDGIRWCLLDYALYVPGFLLSVMISFITLFIGVRYFMSTERLMADVI
tara:strand:+ start:8531 stop:9355 length:825 start_codon:yes stop_codon:yes gene_type:complete